MKAFLKEFCKRGMMYAFGGPLVMAVVYAALGASATAQNLPAHEVSIAIISSTVLAFVAAGITAIYTMERLPLVWAILLHAAVLYADYLSVYLINAWLPIELGVIGIFTAIFALGYAIVWFCIYLITRKRTEKINQKIQSL